VGTPIRVSAYLHIWGTTKSQKIQEKSRKNHYTPSEKNVPAGSNAYLCICYFLKKSQPKSQDEKTHRHKGCGWLAPKRGSKY
jgi:hypothetical protein